MNPLHLSHFTATSCLGHGLQQTLDAMRRQHSGLTACDFDTVDLATYIGEVQGVDEVQMPEGMADYNCRNNRLAYMGLQAEGFIDAVRTAIGRYGTERVGVFMGTSTSGILETEIAFRRRDPVTGALPPDFIYSKTQNTLSSTLGS